MGLNILFTSVGRRGYLLRFFRETEGVGKIVGANSHPLSTGLAMADVSYRTPLIYEEAYVPALLEICRKEEIGMLISLFDADLPVLASAAEEFRRLGVFLLVADGKTIALCNDKLATLSFLKKQGLACAKTFTSLEDPLLEKEFREGRIFFVKPRWGMGSLSLYEAKSLDEADFFYRRVREEIASSYLRFESAADPNRSVLIQERLYETEYGLDVINNLRGEYCTTIVKEKLAMRSGETDVAKTLDHPGLRKLGEKLGRSLSHPANLDVDVMETGDGLFVMDMNARFGGGYPFSHMAGVNLIRCILDWHRGKEPDPENLLPRHGVTFAKDISLMPLPDESTVREYPRW